MEFTPIDIRLNGACTADQVFVKLHVERSTATNGAVEDSLRPAKRTVLVVGIPPWCNEENFIRSLFSVFGDIHSAYLQNAPGPVKNRSSTPFSYFDAERHDWTSRLGFKIGYIVYKKRTSAAGVIDYSSRQVKNPLTLITNAVDAESEDVDHRKPKTRPPLLGPKKWYQLWHAQSRRNINEALLEKEIDTFMSEYDAKKADEKRKAKEMEGQSDAEGWVTVSRHGRKATISRAEAMRTSIFAGDQQVSLDKATKSGGRRGKRMVNNESSEIFMYTNQAKESKMDQLMELRRKFDDDRKRLALMKAARKFKPY